MQYNHFMDITERLKHLSEADHDAFVRERKAVVLIPLIREDEEWKLLFEVRSDGMRNQPGEVCFPGGKVSEGEDPAEALRRECREELCIEDGQLEVLGELGTVQGPRDLRVSVYAGVLHSYAYTYSEEESSAVFSVAVKDLRRLKSVHELTTMHSGNEEFYAGVPGGTNYLNRVQTTEMVYYRTQPVIWGFTARITDRFLELLAEADGDCTV